MLVAAYTINFLGMIVLPIILWIYFTRKFALSWKLVLAGGLTFIASQVLHIPLVIVLGSFLQSMPLLVNASILGLLAGIFEETARYVLFKSILKNARSWKEGVLIGLGHGGMEALLFGLLAAFGFVSMLAYRSGDLSTMPGVPTDQLELARQQVEAYRSMPWYLALMGFIERIFAITLHVSLSVMVLYAIAYHKPIWFWLALLWHALVDAIAVFMVQTAGILAVEGIVAVLAIISLWIVFKLRTQFANDTVDMPESNVSPTLESS